MLSPPVARPGTWIFFEQTKLIENESYMFRATWHAISQRSWDQNNATQILFDFAGIFYSPKAYQVEPEKMELNTSCNLFMSLLVKTRYLLTELYSFTSRRDFERVLNQKGRVFLQPQRLITSPLPAQGSYRYSPQWLDHRAQFRPQGNPDTEWLPNCRSRCFLRYSIWKRTNFQGHENARWTGSAWQFRMHGHVQRSKISKSNHIQTFSSWCGTKTWA